MTDEERDRWIAENLSQREQWGEGQVLAAMRAEAESWEEEVAALRERIAEDEARVEELERDSADVDYLRSGDLAVDETLESFLEMHHRAQTSTDALIELLWDARCSATEAETRIDELETYIEDLEKVGDAMVDCDRHEYCNVQGRVCPHLGEVCKVDDMDGQAVAIPKALWHDVRKRGPAVWPRRSGQGDGAGRKLPDNVTVQRFGELYKAWRSETKFWSSSNTICSHWAYLSIIALGSDVLPLIFETLSQSPDIHWAAALTALTGYEPDYTGIEGDTERITQVWISWAKDHGYLKDA